MTDHRQGQSGKPSTAWGELDVAAAWFKARSVIVWRVTIDND